MNLSVLIVTFSLLSVVLSSTTNSNKPELIFEQFGNNGLLCKFQSQTYDDYDIHVKVLDETQSNLTVTSGLLVTVDVNKSGLFTILCYATVGKDSIWTQRVFRSSYSPAYRNIEARFTIIKLGSIPDTSLPPPQSPRLNQTISMHGNVMQVTISCSNYHSINTIEDLEMFRILSNDTKLPLKMNPKYLSASLNSNNGYIKTTYIHQFIHGPEYYKSSFECKTIEHYAKASQSSFTRQLLIPSKCLAENLIIERKNEYSLKSGAQEDFISKFEYFACQCLNAYPKPRFYWTDSSGLVSNGTIMNIFQIIPQYQPQCCVAEQTLEDGRPFRVEACLYSKKKPYHPKSCEEIKNKFPSSINSLYRIQPQAYSSPILVYCDFTNGSWIVIQRRINGNVDFARSWNEYKQGFGDMRGEFWFGNDNLTKLTSGKSMKIRFEMWDEFGAFKYAEYSSFNISDAADKFRISISGYSGDAGNAMVYHNNRYFSTYDRDNDVSCSKRRGRGGWWYNACYEANLNGKYVTPGATIYTGLLWSTWKYTSMKKIIIKIA